MLPTVYTYKIIVFQIQRLFSVLCVKKKGTGMYPKIPIQPVMESRRNNADIIPLTKRRIVFTAVGMPSLIRIDIDQELNLH